MFSIKNIVTLDSRPNEEMDETLHHSELKMFPVVETANRRMEDISSSNHPLS